LVDKCTNVAGPSCVPQLMLDWDQSSVGPFEDNIAGGASACTPPAPSGKWFSGGNENDQSYEKACSIPNWTAYSFRGDIGLSTNWYKTTASGGNLQPLQEAPDPKFTTNKRLVCSNFSRPELQRLSAPSCTVDSELGDWIEVSSGGDLGNTMASAMQTFIDRNPLRDAFADRPTGPGRGAPLYGPHQIVNVYLWDCGETFDGSALPGSQWSLALPKSDHDCSNIHDTNDLQAGTQIDRVHVLTVATFTFYRGMIDQNKIQGFWGGQLVVSPGVCASTPNAPGCTISPFANSVFLVPED